MPAESSDELVVLSNSGGAELQSIAQRIHDTVWTTVGPTFMKSLRRLGFFRCQRGMALTATKVTPSASHG